MHTNKLVFSLVTVFGLFISANSYAERVAACSNGHLIARDCFLGRGCTQWRLIQANNGNCLMQLSQQQYRRFADRQVIRSIRGR